MSDNESKSPTPTAGAGTAPSPVPDQSLEQFAVETAKKLASEDAERLALQAVAAIKDTEPAAKGAGEATAKSLNGNMSSEAPSIEDFDAILSAEDPEFASAMVALQADTEALAGGPVAEAEAEAALDVQKALLEDALPDVETKIKNQPFRFLIRFAVWLALAVSRGVSRAALSVAKESGRQLGSALKAFGALSGVSKATALAVVILVGLLAVLLMAIWQGKSLPAYQSPFLASFADVADQRYSYQEEDPREDFNSPMRATEHIVLLDRIVANLRTSTPSDGLPAKPMVIIEFYVETSSQDAAVELGDRKQEMRDVAQSAVQSLTFEDLEEPQGKLRLKILVRRDLNAILTKGRVRRVYYKSILLKP